jgi:hypothetical protein
VERDRVGEGLLKLDRETAEKRKNQGRFFGEREVERLSDGDSDLQLLIVLAPSHVAHSSCGRLLSLGIVML